MTRIHTTNFSPTDMLRSGLSHFKIIVAVLIQFAMIFSQKPRAELRWTLYCTWSIWICDI